MDGRRTFLKVVAAGVVNALVTPFRALFAAGENAAARQPAGALAPAPESRVTPEEERVVRAFYSDGWSAGNKGVLASHPATAAECARLFERYRGAFPNLKISVKSVEKRGDQVVVRWSAEGTQRGALDGLKATGRRASISGQTRMKIVEGKIVSTAAEWDEQALKKQLGARAVG